MKEDTTPSSQPGRRLPGGGIPRGFELFINHLIQIIMKQMIILDGAFTSNGNFSGYNSAGERVHIFARQMKKLGWANDEDAKFPFYCLAEVKMQDVAVKDADGKWVPQKDANGNVEQFERLTATAVFATEADIIAATNADELLSAKTKAALTKETAAIMLSVETVASLAEASLG